MLLSYRQVALNVLENYEGNVPKGLWEFRLKVKASTYRHSVKGDKDVNFAVVLRAANTIFTFGEGVEIVVAGKRYVRSDFGPGCMFYDRWTKNGQVIGFKVHLDPRVDKEQLQFWEDLCRNWHGEVDRRDTTVDLFFQAETEGRLLEVTQEFGEIVLQCEGDDKSGVAYCLLDLT